MYDDDDDEGDIINGNFYHKQILMMTLVPYLDFLP